MYRPDRANHLSAPSTPWFLLTDTIRIAGVDKTGAAFHRAHARFRKRAVTPEQAAKSILRGVRRNRYWVYTSIDVHAIHLLQRYAEPLYVLAMRVMNAAANRVLPAVGQSRRSDLPATPRKAAP